MSVTLYHCSTVSGLTVLEPRQCKKDDSPRFGLFFAPTIHNLLVWGGRIYCERKSFPEHVYLVTIDPEQVKVWCDGLRGTRRRWHGGETLLGQVWIQEPIEVSRALTWVEAISLIGE